eukprot:snap_masked-scaffold_28-processed-gene-1.17-mRNA-1 protein AED:1.00 eAED:1.00 QI:0/0/0/0/1/1/2/0/288
MTIVFLLLGTIFHTYLSYNNFLYDREFTSQISKNSSICVVFMAVFYYSGLFVFLKISRELFCKGKSSENHSKLLSVAFLMVIFNTLPFFFIMPYLIYNELISFSIFIFICFLQGAINGILLCFILLFTLNIAIKEVGYLKKKHLTARRNFRELNKIYTFLLKLKGLRFVIIIHTVFLILVTLPNLIPQFNTTKIVLVVDSVYLTLIPVEILPAIFLFSKFIVPGSERCFRVDATKTAVSSATNLRLRERSLKKDEFRIDISRSRRNVIGKCVIKSKSVDVFFCLVFIP